MSAFRFSIKRFIVCFTGIIIAAITGIYLTRDWTRQRPYEISYDPNHPLNLKGKELTAQNITSRSDPIALDGTSPQVRCWPSVGGMIVRDNVTKVELVYLGLNFSEPSGEARSSDQKTEDTFCHKLRSIGGVWFKDWWHYTWRWDITQWQSADAREILYLGWPEGGGLWEHRFEVSELVRKETVRAKQKKLEDQLRKTATMEERCKALEEAGGRFCRDPLVDCYYFYGDEWVSGFGEHDGYD